MSIIKRIKNKELEILVNLWPYNSRQFVKIYDNRQQYDRLTVACCSALLQKANALQHDLFGGVRQLLGGGGHAVGQPFL